MRIFKNILDFYIESSLHVALAVYALIRVTFFKLNIPYDEPVAYFGFYGTVVGYNFIKYDELARIKKVELTTKFKLIIALSVVSFFASVFYFLKLTFFTQSIGILVLLITILYTLPLFPKRENMRNWGGIKIYLVAIAWVGVTVVLPVVNKELDFSFQIAFKCFQRFLFVFILMLLFEIIDLQFDAIPLKTIPQRIGIQKTKLINYLLIVFFLLLEFFTPNFNGNQFVVSLFVSFILFVFTFFANSNRNKYYTSFWVESVPFFWLVLLLVFGQHF
ncbi:hypothetical protein [Flavobacterium sp. N2270]|uniref:hypothetical protein n=1 Tax=Flavobacterium sp. N2270 TaxID=2986831 RepID=UPI0022258B41|nr:hypothetical protein [Flavobacterium sp. N2270]